MNKLLEILKRKLSITHLITKQEQVYFINVQSNQITEEEYNLIKEFLEKEEEENE